MATPSTESGLDAGFADLGLEGPVSSARDDELFSSTSYTEQLAGSPVPGGDESFGGSIHDGSVASESLSNDEAARGPSPGPALFTMGGGEKESRPHEDSASNAQNGFDFSDPAPSQAGQHFPDGLTSSEPTPLEKWRAEKQLELDALEREEAAQLKVRQGAAKKWLADWESEHLETLERTKQANRAKAAAVEHGVYPTGGSTPGDKVPWRSARDMVEELFRRKVMRERQQRSFITTDNNRVELPEDMAKTVGLLAKLAVKQEKQSK